MKRMKGKAAAGALVVLLFVALFAVEAAATGSEKLVFVRGGNIWIANPSGTQERQLTFTGQEASPSLSPDGKWVVYCSGKERLAGYGQLYLLSTTGGPPKKFDIKDMQGAQDPSFSFDGNGFVFVGFSNTKSHGAGDNARFSVTVSVSTVDLLNLKHRTVVSHPNTQLDNPYVYETPSYSPDQALVAFELGAGDAPGGLEVVDTKGKSLFRYPKDPADGTPYRRPRFSPDGSHVLCYSPSTSEGSPDTIYVIDIRKGKKRRIAEGANPTFVEGGRAIVFEQCASRWGNGTKPDLWYMRLGPGHIPRKIISNGSQPSD